MPEPIFERLAASSGLWGVAPRRARRRAPHASAESEPASLASELEMCANFADGTQRGQLVPLADFMRTRIAQALRAAAAALRNQVQPSTGTHGGDGRMLTRVKSAVSEALTSQGLPPAARIPAWRAEDVARIAARAAAAEVLAINAEAARNLEIAQGLITSTYEALTAETAEATAPAPRSRRTLRIT